jgi:hypothetical protein
MITEHWQAVADTLRRTLAIVEDGGGAVDVEALGKAFAASATAYDEAIRREGRTSMRLRAVCKALDLRTPKSALVAFVGAEVSSRG